ncbi:MULTISPECIES: RNA methyltransferase [unclassified Kaistella]|uniref:RNA methyltransferase n=1 Tax=unclassified Kaistella TaxID=2762626 RepID=UPI002736F1EA|nr:MULTISPECIES: RNA methyltransferase [unclassified Kaistella]MCZ2084230.1 RNA methyltransferase [Flavobacteriales bacterium]MDP2453928.1 RNA methyltransferase [Kaistella sp. SH11-4b]MDP2456985.1 RNA methyltransferase [Kaistella sp. SH40-3]MDP2459742.1 RNA methyltransferase [Kaistella sp. SH19-2b]
MLTAHKIKILQSLDKKKFRQKYNLFLVEGNKTIKEIPTSDYRINEVFSVNPADSSLGNLTATEITPNDLKKISFLQHPKDSVAVCELKEELLLEESGVQLILDGIQDPGNLGTIIRLADWFGISQIICSEDTADFYNPKVIQASMGSFLRVNIVYQNLENYLTKNTQPIIGTDMNGSSFYDYKFPEKFNLVLGNEGNGIRPEIEKLLTDKVTIPRFGKSQTTESLNVAMSAGIILGQIFGRK